MNSLVLLCLAGALSVFSSLATAAPASIRSEQVRAFAPETAQSVVVRQGRGLYRRVTTQAECSALFHANRLGFQVGTLLTGVDAGGRTVATTNRAMVPSQILGTTPHAALVAIRGDARIACPIASVVAVDAPAFEAAAQAHGKHDNRHGG